MWLVSLTLTHDRTCGLLSFSVWICWFVVCTSCPDLSPHELYERRLIVFENGMQWRVFVLKAEAQRNTRMEKSVTVKWAASPCRHVKEMNCGESRRTLMGQLRSEHDVLRNPKRRRRVINLSVETRIVWARCMSLKWSPATGCCEHTKGSLGSKQLRNLLPSSVSRPISFKEDCPPYIAFVIVGSTCLWPCHLVFIRTADADVWSRKLVAARLWTESSLVIQRKMRAAGGHVAAGQGSSCGISVDRWSWCCRTDLIVRCYVSGGVPTLLEARVEVPIFLENSSSEDYTSERESVGWCLHFERLISHFK
jgi:hypothetical protein